MLGNLLKYDLKYSFKCLGVFYILSFLFALLTRVLFSIEDSFIMDIIAKISSGTFIAMIVNIIINNFIRVWVRFKTNLYGDESYLTHTLPVEKKDIYLSKMLTGIITFFISTLVIGITLFIAYYSKENIEVVKDILLPLANIYDSTIFTILIVGLFILFLEFINLLQAGYIGLIIGHMMNDYKMLKSIIFGFVTYSISQIVVFISLFIGALFNKELMNLFFTTDIISIDMLKCVIYIAIFIYSFIILVGYFVGIKLFKKGVNVD